MSRPKLPVMHRRAAYHGDPPAIETRPVTVRRMTAADYRRHEALVPEARRKAGTQIKKPLF